jgi:hypothetical protein
MIELISVFSVLELGAVIKKGKIKILKTYSGFMSYPWPIQWFPAKKI